MLLYVLKKGSIAMSAKNYINFLGNEELPTPLKEEELRKLVNRLSRIEGQVNGVKKMLQNDAYCTDILIQVSACQAAFNSFTKELIASHIKGCVAEGIKNGDEEIVDELVRTLQKLMK